MEKLDSKVSFACVVPVYNNGASLRGIVDRTCNFCNCVIVVDDGSGDCDVCKLCIGLDVIILRHEKNLGKGAAILSAMNYLRENKPEITYMITLDADGQHFPEDIPCFIPFMEENDYSLIIGCRDFSVENVPKSSKFGRSFANFWMRVETGLSLRDCQSGFRAYPMKYMPRLKCFTRHYNYETEILTRSAWSNLLIREVNIHTYYPEAEKRISHFRPWLDNFRISLIHTHLTARRLLPIPPKKLRQGEKFDFSIFHPKKFFIYLLKEHCTPGGLGVAAAVGTFIAILPIFGFHSIAIIYISQRFHLNKIMAFNIQHLFMPPLIPFLCIELGYFIRYGHFLTELTFQTLVAEIPYRFWEWLLGSLVLAPFFALVTGGLVYLVAGFFNRRLNKNEV